MLTAYYDAETGELGAVRFSKEFRAEFALLQADVLQELRDAIDGAYDRAMQRIISQEVP